MPCYFEASVGTTASWHPLWGMCLANLETTRLATYLSLASSQCCLKLSWEIGIKRTICFHFFGTGKIFFRGIHMVDSKVSERQTRRRETTLPESEQPSLHLSFLKYNCSFPLSLPSINNILCAWEIEPRGTCSHFKSSFQSVFLLSPTVPKPSDCSFCLWVRFCLIVSRCDVYSMPRAMEDLQMTLQGLTNPVWRV